MIFRVTEKDFFEDNPSALAMPKFSKVAQKLMKYLVLYHDPDSAYRRIYTDSIERRRAIIKNPVIGWGDNAYKTNRTRYKRDWEPAEKFLLSLIKDSDFEIKQLEAINIELTRQIDLVGKKSKTPTEKEECIKVLKDMKNLSTYRQELQDRFNEKYRYILEVESEEVDDSIVRSPLERFHD